MKRIVPTNAQLIPDQAKCVFKGKIFDVYQWQQDLFDGSVATFEMLKRPDTLVAICVIDDRILLVSDTQPNRGTERKFPGGRLENRDASPLEAIKREVAEETGYSFANWRLVHVVQPYAKIEWFVHTYIASEVIQKTSQKLDPGEEIVLHLESFNNAKQIINEDTKYLREAAFLFNNARHTQDMMQIPSFTGKTIDC